jgi:hypothetical protein
MHGERIGGKADEAATASVTGTVGAWKKPVEVSSLSFRKSPTPRRLKRNRPPVLRLQAVITKSGPGRSGRSASVVLPSRSWYRFCTRRLIRPGMNALVSTAPTSRPRPVNSSTGSMIKLWRLVALPSGPNRSWAHRRPRTAAMIDPPETLETVRSRGSSPASFSRIREPRWKTAAR